MADTAALAPAAQLAAGDRAVVTVDIPDAWVGLILAGTVVTIVDLGPGALGPGEDYAAVLADGRDVSFAASELAPERCPAGGGTDHEHCPLHGCVEYVCCVPTAPTGLYVVVMDGHTAADATYFLPGRVSRDEAIRVCDDANATVKNLGLAGGWHIERVG
jgi:hypothetical protein